jgi:hypothetical protein
MDAQYRNAIGKVESDNNYSALGPETDSGDRAYGRYQVMGENVPEWTQRHLGKTMTPQEFLKDTDAQDKVFDGETSAHYKKYGNLDDVTSTWFSGRPMAKAGNDSDGYNTVPQYVSKVNAAYGSGQAAITRALKQPSGSTAMGYAPEDNPNGVLSSAPPPGPLSTTGFDWNRLGDTLINMAPGIAQDPDHAKVLQAAAQANQKVADNGTWSMQVLPDGRMVRMNNKTGQPQMLPGNYAKPEKPEKDKASDAYETATGKAFAEKNQSIADAATSSQGALGNLSTLRAAFSNPEVYQGTNGAGVAYMKKLGNSIGITDYKGVADADVAAALANKLTQESRALNGGMPGSLSDRDLQFLRDANPGLDKTPEANNRIIDIYEKLHNRNIEMNADRVKYTAGGKQLDEGFYTQQAEKYAKKHAADNAAFKTEAPAPKASSTMKKTPNGVSWSLN